MVETSEKRKAAGKRAETDAAPQFAKSQHGARNDGTSSAEPRVLTGRRDGDSTFSNDPDEGAERARRADGDRQSPSRERKNR